MSRAFFGQVRLQASMFPLSCPCGRIQQCKARLFRWKKAHVSSSIATLASLDDINYRIPLNNSKWKSENWRPIPITWRPNILYSPEIPYLLGGPHVAFIAQPALKLSFAPSRTSCPFFTAPLVFCPASGTAAPAAGGGWCWC
eukprot:1141742-Pelagomonas_calceolata.AAC.1